MIQARAQILPLRIMPSVRVQMPKRAAVARQVPPASMVARMDRTFSTVSFFARLAEDVASIRPAATACLRFCLSVHHSKLVTALFAFAKSMWFTCASVLGGSPIKARATIRCTLAVAITFFFDRFTCRYPALSGVCLNTLPCLRARLYRFFTQWSRLRTRPIELTSYRPSYPETGFHFSIWNGNYAAN